MDYSSVLEHLKTQFAGQLVLYVGDLAKVLGKSDKAISNLIARDSLPFKVKMVGGHRCVDIFQMAQWLASDAEMSEQVSQEPEPSRPTPQVSPSRRKKSGAPVALGAASDKPPRIGLMASKILQMRHDYAAPMARFALGLRDTDELIFMHEVHEKLFYCADLTETSFAVTVRRLAPQGFKLRGELSTRFFESEPQASAYLIGKIAKANSARGMSNKHVLHFILTRSTDTLFHAIYAGSSFAVLTDSMGYEFPGY